MANFFDYRFTNRRNDKFYTAWENLKSRCNNPKASSYEFYGGRGISYDKRWDKFENFYLDMHDSYRKELSLDRKDNNKNYSKDNCRWATAKEQANNTRKIDRALKYTFDGLTLTTKQWAERLGIKRTTLDMRLRQYNWSIERALTKGVCYNR